MNHRRLLVLLAEADDPKRSFAALRVLVPGAERAIVIAERARTFPWAAATPPGEIDESSSRALEEIQRAAAGCAKQVEVAISSDLTADALADAVSAASTDLVVVGSARHRLLARPRSGSARRSPCSVWAASCLARRAGVGAWDA